MKGCGKTKRYGGQEALDNKGLSLRGGERLYGDRVSKSNVVYKRIMKWCSKVLRQ